MTTPNITVPMRVIDWRWVAAKPFRAHIRRIQSETGLPWRAVAGAAGVPDQVVRGLLLGHDGRAVRRIAPHYARRLYRLDTAGLLTALKEPVPAGRAIRAAQRLHGIGRTTAALADLVNTGELDIEALLKGYATSVPLRTHLVLDAAVRAYRANSPGTSMDRSPATLIAA